MFGRLKPQKSDSRSIDGMRDARTPEGGAVVLDADVLPWMAEAAAEKEAQKVELERKKAAQQDKIIAFFDIDEKSLVTPEEIVGLGSQGLRELRRKRLSELRRMTLEAEDLQITDKQREEFLKKLTRGEVTATDEANFLLLIRDPIHDEKIGATKMFDRIAADPRQTQILAVAAGYNLKNWQKVDKEALGRILGVVQTRGDDYRTPVGFAKLRKHFLDGIRPKAKEQVYQCYVKSMNELEKVLYGQRLEFYRQFEALRKEAVRRQIEEAQNEPKEQAGVVLQSRLERREEVVPERRMREKFTLINSERGGEMLGRAVINGAAWRGDGGEKFLNTHDLVEAKLGPTYAVLVGDVEISLSRVFQLSSGQTAVMAYVPEKGSYKVRSYYRNAAQGLWCYLPDYVRRVDGGIESYGVGYSSASITLPYELQLALAQIEDKYGVTVARGAEFVFAGTAQAYDNAQEYQTLWSQGKLKGDYYNEVSSEPINHDMGLNGTSGKKAPYTLGIDYAKSPDFGKRRIRFETSTADAGAVEIEGFSSHDGQLVWLFCSDVKGRAWIPHVEAVSPIVATGLRRDWVMMGDFVTPLYEYTSQAGIYGDRSDTRGARQCMWENYLSNVPLIKDYLAQKD